MWDKNYEKCVVCGKTDHKHLGHGMCSVCWKKDKKEKGIWSYKWKCCTNCGTTEVGHRKGGLCWKCYSKRLASEKLPKFDFSEQDVIDFLNEGIRCKENGEKILEYMGVPLPFIELGKPLSCSHEEYVTYVKNQTLFECIRQFFRKYTEIKNVEINMNF